MAFKKQRVDLDLRTVTTTLDNGLVVAICVDDIPESLHTQCLLHGIKQKIGDAGANFSKTTDFAGAFGAMQRVADNLMNGVWSDRGGDGTPDLATAMSRVDGIDIEEAVELLASMDDVELTKLKSKTAIKLELSRIRTERLEAKLTAESARDVGC